MESSSNLLSFEKYFYIVYKSYGLSVTIEYNLYDYNEARNKADTWANETVNRLATVFSFTKNDMNLKEEYSIDNQFVPEQEQKAS